MLKIVERSGDTLKTSPMEKPDVGGVPTPFQNNEEIYLTKNFYFLQIKKRFIFCPTRYCIREKSEKVNKTQIFF